MLEGVDAMEGAVGGVADASISSSSGAAPLALPGESADEFWYHPGTRIHTKIGPTPFFYTQIFLNNILTNFFFSNILTKPKVCITHSSPILSYLT